MQILIRREKGRIIMQGVETVLIYIISIIVLSVIFSEIRFRFFLRREKIEEEYPASYGCICVKCGKCGRKFKS